MKITFGLLAGLAGVIAIAGMYVSTKPVAPAEDGMAERDIAVNKPELAPERGNKVSGVAKVAPPVKPPKSDFGTVPAGGRMFGHMSIGEKAPSFTLPTHDKQTNSSLEELIVDKPVVLFFGSFT